MTELASFPDTHKSTAPAWKQACSAALERRLGWLKQELGRVNGNVQALKEHEQILWRWREKAVAEYNEIGRLRNPQTQIRRYKQLYMELV